MYKILILSLIFFSGLVQSENWQLAESEKNDFTIEGTPSIIKDCSGNSYNPIITIDSIGGYQEDVTLSIINVPSFVHNELLSETVISPPDSSELSFDILSGGTTGVEPLTVQAQGIELPGLDLIFFSNFETGTNGHPLITKTFDFSIEHSNSIPGTPLLLSPINNAVLLGNDVSHATYSWEKTTAASSYMVEISLDSSFTDIIETAVVTTNSFTSSQSRTDPFINNYWRVTALNACGVGKVSATFQYKFSYSYCNPITQAIPDDDPAGIDILFGIGTGFEFVSIESLIVSIISDHTWPGDLIFNLSHRGTSIELMNRPGSGLLGCGQSGINVQFDDTSLIPVDDVCEATSPGIAGIVSPNEPLSQFNSIDLEGEWILNVRDIEAEAVGEITEICILASGTLGLN